MSIDNTNFFSYIYSSWLTRYLWKAYRKGITLSDIPAVSPLDSCSCNIRKFENLWNEELRHRGPSSASLPLVAWRFVRFRVIISCILNISSQIVRFVLQALFLRKLLEYCENPGGNFFSVAHWVLCILVFDLFQTVLYTWGNIMNQRTALRLKSSCLALLFKKVVNANSSGQKVSSEFMNILSTDGHKIYDAINFGVLIVNGPFVTICTVVCISVWLSPSALLGILVFLIFYIGQFWLVHLTDYCKEHADKFTILRIEKTMEALKCIKQIKIHGWEQYFIKNISNIRSKESRWLGKLSYVFSLNSSIAHAIPIIAIIITYYMHFSESNNFKASTAFPICVIIIVQLYQTFSPMQSSLSHLKDSVVTFNKIKTGLLLEDTSCHVTKPYEPSQALAIVNGSFASVVHKTDLCEGETPEDATDTLTNDKDLVEPEKEKLKPNPNQTLPHRVEILSNITLKARKGQLIGISGCSNSGKSALLLAALGQIRMTAGQLMRQGTCAYVAQRSWLVNGSSIKDNILFGEAYDAKRYYEAQIVCKLRQEIKTLTEGDGTVIDQQDTSISESFSQKIALARAFYADRDIYFLDDCLSCMEDKVALEIFENLLLTALGGKTILFVTRELKYLNRCDYMYIMSNGTIAEHGRHKDLMRLGKEYATMVKAAASVDAEGDYTNDSYNAQKKKIVTFASNSKGSETITNVTTMFDSQLDTTKINLDKQVENYHSFYENTDEPAEILATTYYAYFKYLNNIFVLFSIIIVYFIYAGIHAFSLLRLSWWIEVVNQKPTPMPMNGTSLEFVKVNEFIFYRNWYGSCFFLIVFTCIVQSFLVQFATIRIADNLHNVLLSKLINAPLKFYDIVPSSNINNLLLQDISNVSLSLPSKLDSALRYMAICFCTFFILISTISWFTNYVVFITICMILLGKIYKATEKNLKSMENTLSIRINRFLENSIQGLSTIRTFKKELDLLSKFQQLVDDDSAYCFIKTLSENWLSTRLEVLTSSCSFVAAALIITMKEEVSPVIAGLTFVYIWQVPHVIQMCMRYFSEAEKSFVNVQNICTYFQLLTNDTNRSVEYFVPDSQWPSKGLIEFHNVELKFNRRNHPDMECMAFTIRDGEKIGILDLEIKDGNCALVSAMCRLYELSRGTISIDSVDISKIDVKLLRTSVSVVPQDPIFYGTTRFFLDPTKCHDDSEIWNVLEKVHLKMKISGLASQLHYSLDRKMFNVHEKQLLCLAKALLNNKKIIIFEESDISNRESALLIHQILEKEFFHKTVLIVARQLKTVLSTNRILIMNSVRVIEFDRPSILLADQQSYLNKLLAQCEDENCRI